VAPGGTRPGRRRSVAQRLEREHHGSPPPIGGATTLGTFLCQTWLPRKRRQVRATTAYRYAWFVERYVSPLIGDVPLRRLRADHLEDLYHQLATTGGRRGDGLAPKTILEVHMIIRAALDLAVQRELIDRNVAASTQLRLPGAGRTTARVWTAPELATFLAAARRHRLYPTLHLAAHTGMRRGEVVGLKWSDLDTSTRRLSIQRTLQCVGGRPVEFGVKTRHSRRCIDLDTTTVDVLQALAPPAPPRWPSPLRRRLDVLQRHGPVPQPRIAQPALRPHRPAGAGPTDPVPRRPPQLLIAAGVPIKVVSERLGHAHPAFTMHTYQHVLPGMGAAAADQFAALVTAASR